jgi:hypothetical protein
VSYQRLFFPELLVVSGPFEWSLFLALEYPSPPSTDLARINSLTQTTNTERRRTRNRSS